MQQMKRRKIKISCWTHRWDVWWRNFLRERMEPNRNANVWIVVDLISASVASDRRNPFANRSNCIWNTKLCEWNLRDIFKVQGSTHFHKFIVVPTHLYERYLHSEVCVAILHASAKTQSQPNDWNGQHFGFGATMLISGFLTLSIFPPHWICRRNYVKTDIIMDLLSWMNTDRTARSIFNRTQNAQNVINCDLAAIDLFVFRQFVAGVALVQQQRV